MTSNAEHISVTAIPDDPTADILPRAGWSKLEHCGARLGSLPGSATVRERLFAVFVRPLWCWTVPLTAPALAAAIPKCMRAIIRSRCNWWFSGRRWASRVHLHPHTSSVLAAARTARRGGLAWNEFLDIAGRKTMATANLKFMQYQEGRGLLIGVPSGNDDRKYTVLRRAPRQRQQPPDSLWVSCDAGEHALRVLCRIHLLSTIRTSRNDAEGCEDIDPEAASQPEYTKWVASLGRDTRRQLDIYRGGAVRTATRLCQDGQPCQCCGEVGVRPNMRHYMVECGAFDTARRRIEREFGVPASFWSQAPRVTTKSGWITMGAAPSQQRRATLQVATCKLGVAVMQSPLAG